MKKILAFALGTIIIGLFLAVPIVLSATGPPYPIAPYPTIVWKDNFESYRCNKFPSKTWAIVFNGAGTSNQHVSCTVAYDGTHSLHLLGTNGWSATVSRNVPLNINTIGLSVWVYPTATTATTLYVATVSFFWKPTTTYQWGVHIAQVGFLGNGKIVYEDDGSTIGTWTPNTWVKITIILCKGNGNILFAWVYINDVFVYGGDAAYGITGALSNVQSVSLEGQWAGADVYFDAVEVFTL